MRLFDICSAKIYLLIEQINDDSYYHSCYNFGLDIQPLQQYKNKRHLIDTYIFIELAKESDCLLCIEKYTYNNCYSSIYSESDQIKFIPEQIELYTEEEFISFLLGE